MRISPCCGSVNAVGGERSITYLLYAAISIRSRDFPRRRLSSAWWSLQREDAGQRRPAYLDRLPPKVGAVELQQVEGKEEGIHFVAPPAENVEPGEPALVAAHHLAVDQA
jgi:hypothetical protein